MIEYWFKVQWLNIGFKIKIVYMLAVHALLMHLIQGLIYNSSNNSLILQFIPIINFS